jgi:hypothetical protein
VRSVELRRGKGKNKKRRNKYFILFNNSRPQLHNSTIYKCLDIISRSICEFFSFFAPQIRPNLSNFNRCAFVLYLHTRTGYHGILEKHFLPLKPLRSPMSQWSIHLFWFQIDVCCLPWWYQTDKDSFFLLLQMPYTILIEMETLVSCRWDMPVLQHQEKEMALAAIIIVASLS